MKCNSHTFSLQNFLLCVCGCLCSAPDAESKEGKHGELDHMPIAEVDYNLTLGPLQSRPQHIYHGQPYARVDFILQSGTLDLASGVIVGRCEGAGPGGVSRTQRALFIPE